jgi:hypothetical protein
VSFDVSVGRVDNGFCQRAMYLLYARRYKVTISQLSMHGCRWRSVLWLSIAERCPACLCCTVVSGELSSELPLPM